MFLTCIPPPARARTPPPPPPDDFMNDDIDSYLIAMDTSIAPGPSVTGPPTPPLAKLTSPEALAEANHRTRLHSEEEEEEEEDETNDSYRPPNKKVWFSFNMQIAVFLFLLNKQIFKVSPLTYRAALGFIFSSGLVF